MRGVSRTSFDDVRDKLAEVLAATGQPGTGQPGRRTASGRTASGRGAPGRAGAVGPDQIGDDLFAVLHLLDREHGLRRALADPSRPADEKGAVVVALLHGKVSGPAEELIAAVVRSAWASTVDMTDAIEQLAVEAFAAAAEAAGQLDDLEDELFRFSRVIAAEPDLRAALTESAAPPEGKRELLDALLDGKVTHVTLRLITEMSLYPRGRNLATSLEMCTRIAAQRRQRLIAVVRVATELSAPQRRRLAEALAANYGHEVYVNVVIDPTVVGGMTIQIGEELIDASMASRLAEVRRRLAG
jgi:F-type H+-transporting ATPase subunit delta